jgi:hypothetical protein
MKEISNSKSQIPNKLQAPKSQGLRSVKPWRSRWCLKLGFFLVFGVWCLEFAPQAQAHIGDQNVFFEGHAGPYPVRVVVRPPGVIPGLAEISVRVETNGFERVTVLPMRWDTGRRGAPPPDEAKPVRGETNLFSGELWIMRDGAQSVEVAVSGAAGIGKVIVPVNAVATRVLGMTRGFRTMLTILGVVLIALAVSIAGAAVRESVLPAGVEVSSKRQWFARGTIAVATAAIASFLWLGKNWWDAEAADYRNNRLYQTLEAKAQVRLVNGERILTVERTVDPARKYGPLVPEHGKLMHLFLVREPGMDVFAHLHPAKLDWKTFETALPGLPGGEYRVYADVTYETGFSDTLTATVRLPEPTVATFTGTRAIDPDDGWRVSDPFNGGTNTNKQRVTLAQNLRMDMNIDGPLIENCETRLRFAVRDVILRPVAVEHFMGMGGHLILRREDGTVFTHLHPSGSFSMAAQQLFELRVEGKAPMKIGSTKGDPICKLPPVDPAANTMRHEEISFPYAFPKAGAYRLWTQVKVRGEVLTGVFDVKVAPAFGVR